jgi:protein-disulfide isomerase
VGETVQKIEEEYKNDVRIVFKHNPLSFHNRAEAAALAAEAAGKQGKFWPMHDLLFQNSKDLTDENFKKWAKEIKLDVKQFEQDLQDPELKKRVKDQQNQGMKLGARGTPAFFINGRFLSGAQPFERFKTIIDEEIKKADQLISEGTPKDKVYDKVMEKAKAVL